MKNSQADTIDVIMTIMFKFIESVCYSDGKCFLCSLIFHFFVLFSGKLNLKNAFDIFRILLKVSSGVYLFIELSVHLSVYVSICLSIHLSIYLSIYLSLYLSIYLSIQIFDEQIILTHGSSHVQFLIFKITTFDEVINYKINRLLIIIMIGFCW